MDPATLETIGRFALAFVLVWLIHAMFRKSSPRPNYAALNRAAAASRSTTETAG